MAGFSDMPYRSLCREYGSAMSYTEFVSSNALLHESERSYQMLSYREEERPVVFQIFDSEVDRLLQSAIRIEKLRPDIIDINMGCSVKHISGRGAGAALLKEPRKISRIFQGLAKSLAVPFSGKIRLGWELGKQNYLEVAKILEDSGAGLIAVHGRTRSQGYQHEANWDAIAEIVEAVDIPVIGNGDVREPEDIERIQQHTGCVGVMIGRGAIGHPWIFQRRSRASVGFREKARLIGRHFQLMLDFHGERLALLLIRKHIARYLKGYSGIRDLQQQLVRVKSVPRLYELLDEAVERIGS
jgi:nifR3 family TIM-barrel protein